MPHAAPRFIYFDLGKVLFHFDHRTAARQMAELAGVPVERAWQLVFGGSLQWDYERGLVDSKGFHELFCQGTGANPQLELLLEAGSAIFELNVPMVPIVAQLKAAGHRLGILSNTCHAHWDYLNRGRFRLLADFFDVVALSYELRSMKPEPEIYQRAAQLAGVRPDEIFFMDDRLENVEGAQHAGYDAVLFTSAHQLAADLRKRAVRFNY